ncbi:MAG TPA: histidine kinase [Candidatus Binatia bacterium]|jgi:two-component system LytT family sensor kinase|nr:histidine kinase [Candidatus Binatia bacterium]
MNRSSAIRQQLVLWGLVLGLWCLLMLAFTGQLVFTGGLAWKQAFQAALHDWFPWALLAPAVVWLASRFPLERGKLVMSVPVHVVGCLVALVLCEVIARPIPTPLGPPPPGPQMQAGRFPDLPPGGGPDGPLFGGPPPFEGGPPRPGNLRLTQPEMRRARFANALINHAKFNLPIYWIIVTIVRASTLYRRSQEGERQALELQSRLAEAKLVALRMQLHPHFLFNTLNAISTLVHKDADAADEMIGNLSELLRATLDTTEQEIPLREELALLDRYLEIQQVRFGERLRIEKEIDAAALDARVPTLILQPLVENAIRHGIEPQTGQGRLTIGARRADTQVLLTVRDNGAGAKLPAQPAEGIGLANTKARLEELYGQKAKLVMRRSSEGGCSVELEIPYHESTSS